MPTITITDQGEYEAARDVREIEQPANLAPIVIVADPRFVSHGTKITARLCLRIGIMFDASNLDLSNNPRFTERVTHPTMVRPDGKTAQSASWPVKLGPTDNLVGYEFDEPWELVPGVWTFAVMLGDRVLAERRFDVAVSDAVEHRCGTPVS